jgi:hypothetical protein
MITNGSRVKSTFVVHRGDHSPFKIYKNPRGTPHLVFLVKERIRATYPQRFDPPTIKLAAAFTGGLVIQVLAFTLPSKL